MTSKKVKGRENEKDYEEKRVKRWFIRYLRIGLTDDHFAIKSNGSAYVRKDSNVSNPVAGAIYKNLDFKMSSFR